MSKFIFITLICLTSTLLPLTACSSEVDKKSDLSENSLEVDLIKLMIYKNLPESTFKEISLRLPKNCTASRKNREISCPNIPSIEDFSYAGGPDGILTISFNKSEFCGKLIEVISSQYGKGTAWGTDSSRCNVTWQAGKSKGGTKYNIELMQIPGEKSMTFQFAAEQGP
jgi:hypothetical protein